MTDAREDLLRKVLQNIAIEQKYDNPEFQLTAVPPTGANFTSQLFHVVITAPGQEDLKLFAKVAVVGEALRDQAPTKIFDIERYIYKKLANRYAEIEDKHNVPKEHRLVVPKFYGCNETFLEEVIVLEDLSKDGFITYDRFSSIDWPYASKAVEELAKFHALSIAYQKEYPEEYEDAKKVLKREALQDSPELVGMIRQLLGQVAQGVQEENRGKLMSFMMEQMDPEKFMRFYLPQRLPVIIHSDFRQSNLMHKVLEDGSVDLIIVDHQTAHPGCAAIDLLYFIFTGSDGQFRKQYYHQLIDHYYEHMAAALRRLELDPDEVFSREDFDLELKESLPFGLMVAGTMLPMITLDAAQVPQAGVDSMETMAELLMKTSALCAVRLNEVVNDYVEWGVL